jgi:hypothetical protein
MPLVYNIFLRCFSLLPSLHLIIYIYIFEDPQVEAMQNTKNRRNFFLKYAAEKGFDPLAPEDWYKQSRKNIVAVKVCPTLIFLVIYCFLIIIVRRLLIMAIISTIASKAQKRNFGPKFGFFSTRAI